MNIVQEEERRVAGKAPKPAKPRRTGAQSIPRWAYVLFAVLAVLVLLRSFQRGVGMPRTAQVPVRPVTAAKVIEEIKHLPPSEQVEVIQFAVELARSRQLTAKELGELADRLAQADDPAEIIRLKSAMTRGFYGD